MLLQCYYAITVTRRGRGQVCMLTITLFKQMAPIYCLIETAKKFCCSKFRRDEKQKRVRRFK